MDWAWGMGGSTRVEIVIVSSSMGRPGGFLKREGSRAMMADEPLRGLGKISSGLPVELAVNARLSKCAVARTAPCQYQVELC